MDKNQNFANYFYFNPKTPQGPKVPLHSLKSNSKCYNFCIQFPNLIKLVVKSALSPLVCVVKTLD